MGDVTNGDNWFSFLTTQAAAELANRRELQLVEAKARATAASAQVSPNNPLFAKSHLPGWAIPAGIAALGLLVFVAVR